MLAIAYNGHTDKNWLFATKGKLIGITRWPNLLVVLMGPSPIFAHRARPTPLKCKNGASTGGGNCSSGSSRLYRLGVSQAQKAKESGDERPQLRAS